jgi:arylsulfatase A-like enzyme
MSFLDKRFSKQIQCISGALLMAAIPSLGQQMTGTPGSPNATTTITGKQLPAPPENFGGVINTTAKDSKPYWPARIVPPKGAPNVLLIMTDDVGFGAPSTFGGVIPTPALDRIAAMGLRYTNFHSTALCSPSRAALITGRNHHTAGFGVISEMATGFPGYDSVIQKSNATVGEILKDNGYATSWFGKDHNTPSYEASQAGPFDRWPIGLGFEYFYGFVGGDTNQWEPGNLFRNTTAIYPYVGHKGWNLTTAMADDAIQYLNQLNQVAPDKPFFVYYVPGGTHAPHHPTEEWVKKISDMHLFDQGWNKLREQIFANQKKLGVIPQNAQLTPWPKDLLADWDTLNEAEKKLFIRQADVYGAYLAYTDDEIGRVIHEVEREGKLDNTLIIYISGDNGSSAEGGVNGTPNEVASLNGIQQIPIPVSMLFAPFWGSDKTYNHMAVGWTWAFDTPFKWTKQVASHFGGTRQGMAIAWPGHIKDAGAVRNQFHHLIDIVPTILEATGVSAPDTVNGIKQNPIEGVSMLYTFDQANANAPSTRKTQYFEMFGNRAIYNDGWVAATTPALAPWQMSAGPAPDLMTGYNWELYNINEDWTENNNLAAKMPDKLKQMQDLFYAEIKKYNVLPLDNSTVSRALQDRPSPTAGRTEFTYSGEVSGIPNDAAPNILQRSYKITAELSIPKGGATGMIVTQGGRFAGYGFFLSEGRKRTFLLKMTGLCLIPTLLFALLAFTGAKKGWKWIPKILFGVSAVGTLALLVLAFTIGVGKGRPVFLYNLFGFQRTAWTGREALGEGKHTLLFDFRFDGGGWGKGGTGTLFVDGKQADQKHIEHTVPFIMEWDETFDVGMDTGTPVSLVDYEVPFKFTGKIDKLTYKLEPRQIPAGGEKSFEINSAQNNPASE